MEIVKQLKGILGDTLMLGDRADALDINTRLLGGIPEFDSMAVVGVVTAIEETFGVTVDDEDMNAEVFETVGSLAEFVSKKISA